ncbi:hypothetical protein BX265_5598 [Streptomyces sp. TLI_235]|nr:hypothetical protein [Streptomyces sp. TLI_235]PBC71030.1 hypothetical protein BX265_5598 [Streptomyces sp. TLI_235]
MRRVLRTAAVAAGAAMIGYGVYGLLAEPYIGDPLGVLRWAVGGLLLHDGLWLPLVCAAGAVAVRGTAVRAALAVAAAVTAVALPVVLRANDDHGNPSVLPLPYLRNWLLTLAVIALATTAAALLRRHRRRRGPR